MGCLAASRVRAAQQTDRSLPLKPFQLCLVLFVLSSHRRICGAAVMQMFPRCLFMKGGSPRICTSDAAARISSACRKRQNRISRCVPEQTVSLRQRTQKQNRRPETGGRCIPAAAGGRLAFKYPCYYTCISNRLAINHIDISLFTYRAFMQPSDKFRTNSSDTKTPLKSPKTEVFKSYSWLWCEIFESCWLVSCYIWLKAFGGRTGQHQ